jgi:hypothetical protein
MIQTTEAAVVSFLEALLRNNIQEATMIGIIELDIYTLASPRRFWDVP